MVPCSQVSRPGSCCSSTALHAAQTFLQIVSWQSGLISSLKHVTRIGLTKFIAESVWSLGLAKQGRVICGVSSQPAPAGD